MYVLNFQLKQTASQLHETLCMAGPRSPQVIAVLVVGLSLKQGGQLQRTFNLYKGHI
jgi:hypothetical protein